MLEEGSWRILANGWAWKRLRGGQKTKRELWLKEGDKISIFFFHRMANVQRKRNFLFAINVNGRRLIEEVEIKEEVINTF